MAITPNMLLNLPTVSVTLGPQWAQMLNTAFIQRIDLHDHSSGKGVKVTPSGLNINATLSFEGNNASNLKSSRFTSNGAVLTDPLDIRCVYVVGGNLYYNNGAGTPVQITSGSSVIAASDGISRSYERSSVAANTVINPSDTFSFIEVDTNTSVKLTLPQANSVSGGRFYVFKDVIGSAETNNITITPNGSDTIDGVNADYVMDIDHAHAMFVSDNSGNYSLISGVNSSNFFPVGTRIPFYQASAPPGWVIVTGVSDRFLRVVDAGGGNFGGSWSSLSHDHSRGSYVACVNVGGSGGDNVYIRKIASPSWTSNGDVDSGGPQGNQTFITGAEILGRSGTENVIHNASAHRYANVIICEKQ